jgi:hypothetical protein
MVDSSPLEAALEYARAGRPVFPIHTPTGKSEEPCTCRAKDCPQKGKHPCHKNTCKEQGKHLCHQSVCETVGKHPRTLNGVTDAVTDPVKIQSRWETWRDANVGIAAGPKFGMVLDVDPRHGGFETLAALEAKHGKLPETLTADTGGDGAHFVFEYPDFEIRNLTKGELGPGLDLKTAGGYIVAPPSLHASGKRYRWRNNAPIVKAPEWFLGLLREVMAKKSAGVAEAVGEEIAEKKRNTTLISLAGSMRRRGMGAAEILAALKVTNEQRCRPPLSLNEVQKIAESVSRYAPADESHFSNASAPPEEPEWVRASFEASPQMPEATKKEGREAAPIAVSWADFDAEQFPQGERIAFAAERGEIALLNALPNTGKTTLALNVAVCLAAGRGFPPMVTERKPRRVLYIDGETRRPRLQRDLRTMTKGFSREEAMAVGQNLHIICEAEIKGESIALTRTDHLVQLSADALRVKPDFIVIDTLSSLCPVFNENDNAEQTRKVWRPLQKIARDCDAAMLVNHHVGKHSEDSLTPERVYRGRGASASGGAARAVWLLLPDPVTPGLSTLACVKAKGETPADVRLQLDPATRWIRILEAVAPGPTPLQIVAAAVTEECGTAEIVAKLKDRLKSRAVKDYLAEAVEQGLIRKVKYGVYAPKSAENAQSAKDQNAQPAQSARSKKGKSAESAGVIGGALSALSDKPNENGGLSKSAESALSMEGCTPCTLENGTDKGHQITDVPPVVGSTPRRTVSV